MSGQTAGGWPYVTPDDHPLEFPTHSQTLANKLEASAQVVGAAQLTGHNQVSVAGTLLTWKASGAVGAGVVANAAGGTLTIPPGWWSVGWMVNSAALPNLGLRVWNGSAWVPYLVGAQSRAAQVLYKATATVALGLYVDSGSVADDTAASAFHVSRLAP